MKWIRRRKQDFTQSFSTPSGQRVLADLYGFCLADGSAFSSDPYLMARNTGRQEVWIHIRRILNWDETRIEAMVREYERMRRSEETT